MPAAFLLIPRAGGRSNSMLVGLTYDLRDTYISQGFSEEETAEFDKMDTVDALDEALCASGYETVRIGNIKNLTSFLQSGGRCDIVFNIAEGVYGMGREAQVPALLDAYRIPYTFSETHILALTLHKGFTKAVLRQAGVPTADFITLDSPQDISKVNLPYPLFVKPAGGGTSMGIDGESLAADQAGLERTAAALMQRFSQPVLVETFLPGREFTVGIVGTGRDARAVGTAEITFTTAVDNGVYSYTSKQHYAELVHYALADAKAAAACEAVALQAWRILNCRDAGRVDLRMDFRGKPFFLEVNPLAGLNPVDSDLPIICRMLGIPYQHLIQEIMVSARKRLNLTVND